LAAQYILLGLGCVFLVAAVVRLAATQWRMTPAARAWLLTGSIFVLVAIFLLSSI
jgi:hypothetical protein